jgi:pimeloyl-ACP methyl ester carboxylesterase
MTWTNHEQVTSRDGTTIAVQSVFGHSYGGLVVLEAMAQGAGLATAIVFEPGVSINGSIPTTWLPAYREMLGRGDTYGAFTHFIRSSPQAPAITRLLPRWYLRMALHAMPGPRAVRQLRSLGRERTSRAHLAGTGEDLADLVERLRHAQDPAAEPGVGRQDEVPQRLGQGPLVLDVGVHQIRRRARHCHLPRGRHSDPTLTQPFGRLRLRQFAARELPVELRILTPLTSENRRVAPLELALTKVAPSNSFVPE